MSNVEKIPAGLLSWFADEYVKLPFRNGTPCFEDVSFSTCARAWVEIEIAHEGEASKFIQIHEEIEFDEDSISDCIRSSSEYTKKLEDVKTRLEFFARRVSEICVEYSIDESDLWKYLYTLPSKQ